MKRLMLLTVVWCGAAAAVLTAQTAPGQVDPGRKAPDQSTPANPKPNFSGRWRMLKEKSDFGSFHMPDIVVQVVDHHEPTINVHTVETADKKTTTADVSYFTDGSASKNMINGRDAESKAFWDGAALLIRTTEKDSKSEPIVIEDRWELSGDGQTLTRTSHITTSKGESDLKLVSEKEKDS